jgi:hypothetical protein
LQEFLGEFLRYEVQVAGARVVVDHVHARGASSLATGTPVTLSVPASEIRFIVARCGAGAAATASPRWPAVTPTAAGGA